MRDLAWITRRYEHKDGCYYDRRRDRWVEVPNVTEAIQCRKRFGLPAQAVREEVKWHGPRWAPVRLGQMGRGDVTLLDCPGRLRPTGAPLVKALHEYARVDGAYVWSWRLWRALRVGQGLFRKKGAKRCGA